MTGRANVSVLPEVGGGLKLALRTSSDTAEGLKQQLRARGLLAPETAAVIWFFMQHQDGPFSTK